MDVEQVAILLAELRVELRALLLGTEIVSGLDVVFSLPRSGTVSFRGQFWEFTKHGYGGVFRASSGLIVDIARLDQDPRSISMDELETFVESAPNSPTLDQLVVHLRAGGNSLHLKEP